jgi:hypothetical protein
VNDLNLTYLPFLRSQIRKTARANGRCNVQEPHFPCEGCAFINSTLKRSRLQEQFRPGREHVDQQGLDHHVLDHHQTGDALQLTS